MIDKKKILFVVHRYYPYPGGSEYYTQNMAEECVARGYEATVLTAQHKISHGKHNGVFVATDPANTLNLKWDLIVVHGDASMQNVVHVNSNNIRSPILYLIIKPGENDFIASGLKHSEYLGYSTSMDIQFIKDKGYSYKARRVRHGVKHEDCYSLIDFMKHEKPYFVSAGGFYPNKMMKELATAWEESKIDAELYIFGYGMLENAPSDTSKVKVIKEASKDNLMNTLRGAEGYIMNSSEEGFGLVLIEAMLNGIPWFAKNIAGARDMKEYGYIYNQETDLISFLEKAFCDDDRDWWNSIEMEFDEQVPFQFAMQNHLIQHTVDDIEDVIMEAAKSK